MLMETHAEAAWSRSPAVSTTPMRDRARAYLPVSIGAAVWILLSASFIGGYSYWASNPEALVHLALSAVCIVAAVACGARIQGSLEFKLGQAALTSILIVGVYALTILAGRLFFTRLMLVSAACGAATLSCALVWLRHRLDRGRVALIGPLLGDVKLPSQLGQVVNDPKTDLRGFDIVLVSLTEQVSAEWSKALSRAMLAGCKVRHVGEYIEELRGAVSLDHFDVDHLPPNGIASYKALKRAMDIGLVVFILPVVLPVMALAMAAVFVTMGRPIFFVQERVGLGGEPFRMWKLRTMRPEREGEALKPAVVGDARVTPIGRILRRFRIDELPQLWNVLKGDMSLIGPRPEAVALHEQYLARLPNYAYRYLVRPGITGWAQVSAPPSANAEEARTKLTYDLFYVKKLSLYLDVQIVIRTFWTITSGSGVR